MPTANGAKPKFGAKERLPKEVGNLMKKLRQSKINAALR
jgi:hypothetical protein